MITKKGSQGVKILFYFEAEVGIPEHKIPWSFFLHFSGVT